MKHNYALSMKSKNQKGERKKPELFIFMIAECVI